MRAFFELLGWAVGSYCLFCVWAGIFGNALHVLDPLKHQLRQFRWYRRLYRGPWYLVRVDIIPSIWYWSQDKPKIYFEHVEEVELKGVTVTKLLGY